jgi:hypothetical protein
MNNYADAKVQEKVSRPRVEVAHTGWVSSPPYFELAASM